MFGDIDNFISKSSIGLLVVLTIHFDPDPTSCGTGPVVHQTPPTVKFYKLGKLNEWLNGVIMYQTGNVATNSIFIQSKGAMMLFGAI